MRCSIRAGLQCSMLLSLRNHIIARFVGTPGTTSWIYVQCYVQHYTCDFIRGWANIRLFCHFLPYYVELRWHRYSSKVSDYRHAALPPRESEFSSIDYIQTQLNGITRGCHRCSSIEALRVFRHRESLGGLLVPHIMNIGH